jgi:hypothetical protein
MSNHGPGDAVASAVFCVTETMGAFAFGVAEANEEAGGVRLGRIEVEQPQAREAAFTQVQVVTPD